MKESTRLRKEITKKRKEMVSLIDHIEDCQESIRDGLIFRENLFDELISLEKKLQQMEKSNETY